MRIAGAFALLSAASGGVWEHDFSFEGRRNLGNFVKMLKRCDIPFTVYITTGGVFHFQRNVRRKKPFSL
jgi:hypothetical protein